MLIQKASLVSKQGHVVPSAEQMRQLLGLAESWEEGVMGEETDELVELGLAAATSSQTHENATAPTETATVNLTTTPRVSFAKRDRWFAASISGPSEASADVGQHVRQAFDAISQTLASQSPSLSLPLHTQHITLLLSSMSLFPAANAAYQEYFGTSPPSRACVAVDLPAGVNVRVEVVGFKDDLPGEDRRIGGRSALHVQGVSYWAPANIGPYSQSVLVRRYEIYRVIG
jgi:diphthine-ammonia ligase